MRHGLCRYGPMENPVSSSWGCTNSQLEAESLSKTNRVKEAFQKDYETLRKFIDMMKSAEWMSVEDYNDAIIEKHNESVGFLKTAIFQAQSNVLDEVARQREAATKTKFTYMKMCGLQRQIDNHNGGAAKRSEEIQIDARDDGENGSNTTVDDSASDEVGAVEDDKAIVSRDEKESPDASKPRSKLAISISARNKILSSLRKVASKSTMGDAAQPADKPAAVGVPSTTLTSKSVCPPVPVPPCEPSPTAKQPHEDGTSSNVFDSLTRRSSNPKVKILSSLRKVASKSTMMGNAAQPASKPTGVGVPSTTPISKSVCPPAPVPPRIPSLPAKKPNEDGASSNVFDPPARQSSIPRIKPRGIMSVQPLWSERYHHQLKRPAEKRFGHQSVQPPASKKARPLPCLARSYEIGAVVMAKYLKYSYWPAIVVKRPPFSIEYEDYVHVMFWEGKETKMKTSLADVHFSMVSPWTDRDEAQDLVPKSRRRKDWNDAVDLAEEMVLLTQEERFWKMILIEEKFDLEIDYRPERDANHDKGFPQKGDVVVVGRDTFYPGIVTKEELFFENLNEEIYYVNGHIHVSFMEENTHGWYPVGEVWILGKSRGEPWPVPTGAPGQKIRHSMEVARNVLKMPRDQRFRQIGAFAMQ